MTPTSTHQINLIISTIPNGLSARIPSPSDAIGTHNTKQCVWVVSLGGKLSGKCFIGICIKSANTRSEHSHFINIFYLASNLADKTFPNRHKWECSMKNSLYYEIPSFIYIRYGVWKVACLNQIDAHLIDNAHKQVSYHAIRSIKSQRNMRKRMRAISISGRAPRSTIVTTWLFTRCAWKTAACTRTTRFFFAQSIEKCAFGSVNGVRDVEFGVFQMRTRKWDVS